MSFWVPEGKLSYSPKIKTHKLYVLIAEGLLPPVVLLVFLLKVPSQSPLIGWAEVPSSFSLAVVRLFSPLWELKCMKLVMIHSNIVKKSQRMKAVCGLWITKASVFAPESVICLLVAVVNKMRIDIQLQ